MSERYQRGEPLAKAAQRLRELAAEAPAKEAAARLAMAEAREQHIDDDEPLCHCGRLAEDDMDICGHCIRDRYASTDDTCCGREAGCPQAEDQ